MLQAVHFYLDYLGKSYQLAQSSFNFSSLLILIPFKMQLAYPYFKPCCLQASEPSNLPSYRVRFVYVFTYIYVHAYTHMHKLSFNRKKCKWYSSKLQDIAMSPFLEKQTKKNTQLEHKHSNSRSEQIHINVTVKVQNIMCHCFSPPPPKRLLKTHFIHRVTVWAVYLINMTTQHTQDFFQFHSFAFSHFTQKEHKVTTIFYFIFCQYAIISLSWFILV